MGPEKKIQKKVVEWAREKYAGRLIARKFQGGPYGAGGWPDYDILVRGVPPSLFFMEFKAPDGKCTALQLQRHNELRSLGFRVYVVDSNEDGKNVIATEMNRTCPPPTCRTTTRK